MTKPDRQVIACNHEGSGAIAQGAKAYITLLNVGGGSERVQILVRSRGGRWVQTWTALKKLDNFRVKTLPPEHFLYADERLLDHNVEVIAGNLRDRRQEISVAVLRRAAEQEGIDR